MQFGDFAPVAGVAEISREIPGLDQVTVTVPLPRSLAGTGAVEVRIEVDGSVSNTRIVRMQ